MLSRIAESMFWIGRYVERAEDTARLLQTHLRLLVEDSSAAEVDACRNLLALMSVDHIENPTHDDLLRVLGYDRREPTSIFSCWAAARDNARRAREVIPLDLWECINTTWQQLPPGAVRGGQGAHVLGLGAGAQRPVHRHRPRHHGPRRRLAVHVAGPQPGAGRHDLADGGLGRR